MSDAKKTGSRDISELKHRLGLKKGVQTGPQPRANGTQSGGVVAPPGLNLPPPPGVTQTAPQPAIPNAATDPFGAMNAMAAVGQVQRAPEIVIVNDGRPVEDVGSGAGSILKFAIPAVLALVVGIAIGNIGRDASTFNKSLEGAKTILGDKTQPLSFLGLRKTLSDLDTLLDDVKSKKQYHPDVGVDKQLDAIAKRLDVNTAIYQINQNAIDGDGVVLLHQFYAGVAEIKGMLDTHVKAAASDDLALAAGKKATNDATLKDSDNAMLAGQIKYGVLVTAQDEKSQEFGARIVELGPPYCGDRLATSGKCENNESPSAYSFRNDAASVWNKGELASPGESIPTKRILLILQNGVRDALIKGGEAGASEIFYVRRLKALAERTQKLLKEAEKLETALNTTAAKKSRFSFFM